MFTIIALTDELDVFMGTFKLRLNEIKQIFDPLFDDQIF